MVTKKAPSWGYTTSPLNLRRVLALHGPLTAEGVAAKLGLADLDNVRNKLNRAEEGGFVLRTTVCQALAMPEAEGFVPELKKLPRHAALWLAGPDSLEPRPGYPQGGKEEGKDRG